MARFDTLDTQYFDDAGNPLAYGFVQFYESGTTTDKDTFSDVNLQFANTNPIQLSVAGRFITGVFFNGSAKAISYSLDPQTNSPGVQYKVLDPVGGEFQEGVYSPWNALTIYSKPDIVIGSDGLFYISITDGNQGNDPTTDAVNWTQFLLVKKWNPNETYNIDDLVQGSNGFIYTALVGTNLNNDPVTDNTNWGPITAAAVIPPVIEASAAMYAYLNF